MQNKKVGQSDAKINKHHTKICQTLTRLWVSLSFPRNINAQMLGCNSTTGQVSGVHSKTGQDWARFNMENPTSAVVLRELRLRLGELDRL